MPGPPTNTAPLQPPRSRENQSASYSDPQEDFDEEPRPYSSRTNPQPPPFEQWVDQRGHYQHPPVESHDEDGKQHPSPEQRIGGYAHDKGRCPSRSRSGPPTKL